MYKEIFLDARSIEYIKECLIQGKTFAEYLLRNFDLHNSKVITILSDDITYEEAHQFKYGGKHKNYIPKVEHYTDKNGKTWRSRSVPDMDPLLTDIICSYLKEGDDRFCIFEEVNARPNDPCILRAVDRRIMIYDDEIYYFLTKDTTDKMIIEKAIKYSELAWLFIGAMTSYPHQDKLVGNRVNITFDDLKLMADNVKTLIIGAYDGEGFLLWERNT